MSLGKTGSHLAQASELITGRRHKQPEEEWSPCHKRAPGGLNDGGWQETAGPAGPPGPELRYRSLGVPSWGGPPREPPTTSWKAGQMSYGFPWVTSGILAKSCVKVPAWAQLAGDS